MNHDNNQQGLLNPNIQIFLKLFFPPFLSKFPACTFKPASHCLILKSLMALVLTNVIGCDSCLLSSHPIFRSHCPTDRIRFLLCLSHNAFGAMIEMNNQMRSIRSSLTCQSPSDSIRFFKIASDRPIVRSHCPILCIYEPTFSKNCASI